MKLNNFFKQLLNTLLVSSKIQNTQKKGTNKPLNFLTHLALRIMAVQFNYRPLLKRYMKGKDGWINFSVGLRTENKSVEQAIIFHNGKVHVVNKIPSNTDIVLIFFNDDVLKEMAKSTPNEMLLLILKNKMVASGNLACLQIFNFYISLSIGKIHQKKNKTRSPADVKTKKTAYTDQDMELERKLLEKTIYRIKGKKGVDKKVKYLDDPFLPEYSIDDFPRLMEFLDIHFNVKPEICSERPKLLTEWYRKNGFERDKDNKKWFPELRQAFAFNYLMKNKKPVIRKNDLIAGTTTSKETGVTIFPDGQGTMIWGELNSIENRELNPYTCTKETTEILHNEVFPFWMHRSFREYVRVKNDYPHCQKLDERFVAYFVWKSVGISHTIPNFERLLQKGSCGIIDDVKERLTDDNLDIEQKKTLDAMRITLEGVNAYALNLSWEAKMLSYSESDKKRADELSEMSRICEKVPHQPADTLYEALNSIFIIWAAIHMENSNTGTSLGRLDQWLQPYFEKDMANFKTNQQRRKYIKKTIERIGCFFMRLTDHVPLIPDIGNYLFGGASSTQAITVGGITKSGEDAVNDMTYIFLKVTEMLSIRDANLNARYHGEKNSENYLKRLCDVNVITCATPIMQNDCAMIKALSQHGYPREDINDWAATGCVEPTLQGQNFSHTASILLNMVASMEMALNNGVHPVMHWQAGPETGTVERGEFKTFEDFFNAWKTQQEFIIGQAVKLNNLMGKAHQEYRPTPLLSALIDGTIESCQDVLRGGAKYNSSGTSNIGLVDVTDSLLVIRQLVFDEKKVSFLKLKEALESDFKNDPGLHAMVQNKVKLFGSGDEKAIEMANRVAKVIHDCYMQHQNYRGGRYSAGFWSMSQHVAYGALSGTLPSGRLAGKAFTPGLTPTPKASHNFLDNISSVAQINPEYMDNNIAFNVKLNPGPNDTQEQTVNNMHAYVKAYFNQGGMQIQFNVVSSEILKDAMINPEDYKNLMVRISGYNAYFVTLNREIQTELIERAEFRI